MSIHSVQLASPDTIEQPIPEARPGVSSRPGLHGKRVGMVVFSSYPADPRPRRAIEALLREGMTVDLICQGEGEEPRHELLDKLEIARIPIKRIRGGKLSYAYQYSLFILLATWHFAVRAIRERYDLIYVHNMPDVLVVTSLIPKMLGAKVILDQHDPMPELMMTIFGVDERNWAVRLLAWLEKWSIARVDQVVTVNIACKRLFSQRSCPPEKIGIVMNCPDTTIFPFRAPESYSFPCREARKPFVIMYHGSLVERNGLDLAVDALEAVRESVPNAELRIYGKRTPFLDRVMEKVNHKRLSGSVLYLGPKKLEDLVAEITQCDVGVIPNHNNPFTEINTPTRIFEYLALGKPVIAPRTPGIQDYFSSDSLYFFEAGDPQDLSRRIEEAYSDSSRARATAERGQQVYLAHQWSSESRALVAMIEQLLHGDRRN